MLETILDTMIANKEITALVFGGVLEFTLRKIPTEKRGSIFSWIGKALMILPKVSFFISDILGKVIEDKRKTIK